MAANVREFTWRGKTLNITEASDLENEAGAVVWDAALVFVNTLMYMEEHGEPRLGEPPEIS